MLSVLTEPCWPLRQAKGASKTGLAPFRPLNAGRRPRPLCAGHGAQVSVVLLRSRVVRQRVVVLGGILLAGVYVFGTAALAFSRWYAGTDSWPVLTTADMLTGWA